MKIRSYNSFLRAILRDIPCILAYDTAADYLGMTEGCDSSHINLFVDSYNEKLEQISKENSLTIHQIVVSSFSKIRYENFNGLNCTTPEQTIIHLLEQDGDNQVIQETLASYYFANSESFKGLLIPEFLQLRFEEYSDWAIHYYDEY
ncbi:MAG: hypothetical protein IKZ53_01360 [Selenomonadaceae bacterium]|nr:hypothetical protein [Selenomonadaceae bacterium]